MNELREQLPVGFYDMALGWMEELDFQLKITRQRKTKLGDFRFDVKTGQHLVSVNRTENKWSFLITFAHEAAHSLVYRKYGSGTKHHGIEWKASFRIYLLQILSSGLVPEKLAKALAAYAKNPRASTFSFQPLVIGLSDFNSNADTRRYLYQSQPGSQFKFNGKVYTLLNKRRTRALCEQSISGRRYLISLTAEVFEN